MRKKTENNPTNKHKYNKVSEDDVVNMIMHAAHAWRTPGIISPSNIAGLLTTSRYQVNKHIKSLKNKGLIVYESILTGPGDDYYPPYNGYCLSESGKEVYKKELKELEEIELRLINECFGK